MMKLFLFFWTINIFQIVCGRHITKDQTLKNKNVKTLFENIFENLKTFMKDLHATEHTNGSKEKLTQWVSSNKARTVQRKSESSSLKTTTIAFSQSSQKSAASIHSAEAPKLKVLSSISTRIPAETRKELALIQKPTTSKHTTQLQSTHLLSTTQTPVGFVEHTKSNNTTATNDMTTTLGKKKEEAADSGGSVFRVRKAVLSTEKPTTVSADTKLMTTYTTATTTIATKEKLHPKCLALKKLKLPLTSDCGSMSAWN